MAKSQTKKPDPFAGIPAFIVDPKQRGIIRGGWYDEMGGILVGAYAQNVVDALNRAREEADK